MMFYLNDVEEGGETAFPAAGNPSLVEREEILDVRSVIAMSCAFVYRIFLTLVERMLSKWSRALLTC